MGRNVKQAEKRFPFCTYGRIESDVFCVVVPYFEDVVEKAIKDFTEALINYNPSYKKYFCRNNVFTFGHGGKKM